MIFVTVGTQLPFDRLVRTVDEWAGRTGRTDVFAQIGPTSWQPRHIRSTQFLDADECQRRIAEASVVVAHAGTGTIIAALELRKPIVIMPRRAEFREHRNDHQLATARRFLAQGYVDVAFDEESLVERLNALDQIRAGSNRIAAAASPRLLSTIRAFVQGYGPSVDPGLGSLGIPEVGTDVPSLTPAPPPAQSFPVGKTDALNRTGTPPVTPGHRQADIRLTEHDRVAPRH